MQKKNIAIFSILLISNIVNLIFFFSSSTIRDCENILSKSQRNFNDQYNKLVQVTISNNVQKIQAELELKLLKGKVEKDFISLSTNSLNLVQLSNDSPRNIFKLPYDYVIVNNSRYILVDGLTFSVGDYLPEGRIISINQNFIELENGDIVARIGRANRRQSDIASTDTRINISGGKIK